MKKKISLMWASFFKSFIKKNFVNKFYFNATLFENRIDEESVRKATEIFKKKFPDKELIIITDVSEFKVNPYKYYKNIKNGILKHGVLAFESDQKAYEFIKLNEQLKYVSAQSYYPTARFYHKNDLAHKMLQDQSKVQKEKFEVSDYENILQILDNTKNLEGDYVEIGVYKGGSAYTALNFFKSNGISKNVFLLDTFEGFNYHEASISSDTLWQNTHGNVSIPEIEKFLEEFNNYTLVKSNIIADELPEKIKKISVCNIDVDMYEAIIAALHKVVDLIEIGGFIILEDVGHTPALIGAHVAYKEFTESSKADNFHNILLNSGQAILIRYK